MEKTILVTGGGGYIGSHCCVELLIKGFQVIAIDNFANCVETEDEKAPALKRVEEIAGKEITFIKCDLLDAIAVNKIFVENKIECVIHLAALRGVGESNEAPIEYYKNNLIGTLNLLDGMSEGNCYNLVFSSSCTVYGNPQFLPITEAHPTGNVTNVYGRTKYFIEKMLQDLAQSDKKWRIISLRYFNPIGAHVTGLIGEDPSKMSSLVPFISAVASGKLPHVTIHGNNYNTPDGTGMRDYIHIMDLADGHVAAVEKILRTEDTLGYLACNLGRGEPTSVLELIGTFEKVSGRKVPYKVSKRRDGDIPKIYANCDLAEKELGWRAKKDLQRMCEDFWRWQQQNPTGYDPKTQNK